MITREHIKQAVDAISRRDPEIGYSLDEMLGMGLIDASPVSKESTGEDFSFRFEGQKVLVNRFLFFHEGTAPIEQGLLIKYGELVKRQEIQDGAGTPDYKTSYSEIREAGLRLAVRHEIGYAISRLEKEQGRSGTVSLLKRIRAEERPLIVHEESQDPPWLYRGNVDAAAPAFFMCFPLCMGSLMQVADLNLEFFHVRFVLNCLLRGTEKNLLACVVQNRIAGLIFLALKERFLRRDVEIRYIATLRGKRKAGEAESALRPLKGVGAFMVAGVWMLLRNEEVRFSDIVLDAEIGARGFYEALGFESRGFSGYVLRTPRARLLQPILRLARNCQDLRKGAISEISKSIRKQVKALRKRPHDEAALLERKVVIACIRECLSAGTRPEFAAAALEGLLKNRKSIAESEELLRSASEKVFDSRKTRDHAARTSD